MVKAARGRCIGSYQDVPFQFGWYSRQPGSRPDNGQIIVSNRDLKLAGFEFGPNFFVPVGDLALPQPMSIQQISELPPRNGRFRRAQSEAEGGEVGMEEDGGAEGKVLGPAGTLIFAHGGDQKGERISRTSITFEGIYVSPDGAEEVQRQISRDTDRQSSALGDAGEIRISLTDIRAFWHRRGVRMGGVYARFNVRLPSGELDVRTLHKGGDGGKAGEKFTLDEIFAFVCHHLPGSPPLVLTPRRAVTSRPENIIFDFESASDALDSLLERYGMDVCLTPANELWIFDRHEEFDIRNPRVRNETGIIELTDSAQKGAQITEGPYERTAYPYVPDRVRVVGAPVRENVEKTLVPACLDLQGRVRKLDDVLRELRIPKKYVLDGVLVERAKQFLTVGQFLVSDAIVRKTILILRECAFKWWAVQSALDGGGNIENTDLPMLNRTIWTLPAGVPGLDDFSTEFGLLDKSVVELGVKPSDAHILAEAPPKISASAFFSQFDTTDIGLLRRAVLRELGLLSDAKREVQALLGRIEEIVSAYLDVAVAEGVGRAKRFGVGVRYAKKLEDIIDETLSMPTGSSHVGIEAVKAMQSRRIQELKEQAIQRARDQFEAILSSLRAREEGTNEQLERMSLPQFGLRLRRSVWFNRGGVIPDGSYQILPRHGFVRFAYPLVETADAISTTLSSWPVLDQSFPIIEYAVEVRNNEPTDRFVVDVVTEDGKTARVEDESLEPKASFISAAYVMDPNMVLRVDRQGNKFNAAEVANHAIEVARPILTAARKEDSAEFIFGGLVNVFAGGPVSSVGWRLESNESAVPVFKTTVQVNSFGRGVAGRAADAKRARAEAPFGGENAFAWDAR